MNTFITTSYFKQRVLRFESLVFVIVLIFSVNSQPCDVVDSISSEKAYTMGRIKNNKLIGNWTFDTIRSEHVDEYGVERIAFDSLALIITEDSINYVLKYRCDTSYNYKEAIIGTWGTENNIITITGQVYKAYINHGLTKIVDKMGWKICLEYSVTDNSVCFYSVNSDKFHDGPYTESRCFYRKQ